MQRKPWSWVVFAGVILACVGGCTMYLAPDELKMQKSVESRLGNLEGRVGRIEQQIDTPVLMEDPSQSPFDDPALRWEIPHDKAWPEVKP